MIAILKSKALSVLDSTQYFKLNRLSKALFTIIFETILFHKIILFFNISQYFFLKNKSKGN